MTNFTNENHFDTDVVIVGAGPIGLILANSLAHHGVRFRVFEKRTEPREYSRANNLWSRPQELLAAVGARDVIAENAYAVNRINVGLNGTMLQQIDGVSKSSFGAVLYSGQDVIETQLETLVAQAGTPVERGRTVLGHSQDESEVTVIVGDDRDAAEQGGTGEQVRCRYLVGADGDGATIRTGAGLDLQTTDFPDRATRQMDVKLKWRRSTNLDQLWFFAYKHGFAGVMPVWGGYHRIFFIEDDTEMAYRDPTLEEICARLREITGDTTIELSDPIWSSHGRFSHGITDTYSSGRVFLVGDAGHHTIPIGGQGMNAGVHDAVTLAWRLAMTLDGIAQDCVLDSFGPERRDSRAELDAEQTTGFNRLMYRNPVTDRVLKGVAEEVPNIGVMLIGVDDQHQLSTGYPNSALNDDRLSAGLLHRDTAVKPGERAPDAEVVDEATSDVRPLFDCIYNPDGHSFGWCLLGFDGGDPDAHDKLAATFESVADVAWIHPWSVVADPAASASNNGPRRLFDLDGTAHDVYGLHNRSALMLIRPDGHIAYRGEVEDSGSLASYVDRIGLRQA